MFRARGDSRCQPDEEHTLRIAMGNQRDVGEASLRSLPGNGPQLVAVVEAKGEVVTESGDRGDPMGSGTGLDESLSLGQSNEWIGLVAEGHHRQAEAARSHGDGGAGSG